MTFCQTRRILLGVSLAYAAATSTKYNDEDNKDILNDDNEVHDKTCLCARTWLERNAPPIFDLASLCGSDFSDDKRDNNALIPFLTIKDKAEAESEELSGPDSTVPSNWIHVNETTNLFVLMNL